MTTKLPDPSCVAKVDGGRGFIIEQRISTAGLARPKTCFGGVRLRPFVERRLVLTAAHCLPKLPPALHVQERTYPNLLGKLFGGKNDVWAECLFVDPISDLAVLGAPDNQTFENEPEAYDALIEDAPALLLGKAQSGKGWVLALDGHWIPTPLHVFCGLYGTSLSIGPSEAGMSGSPVLNDRGRAVGIVSLHSESGAGSERHVDEKCGLQPFLARDLPAWLTQSLKLF